MSGREEAFVKEGVGIEVEDAGYEQKKNGRGGDKGLWWE